MVIVLFTAVFTPSFAQSSKKATLNIRLTGVVPRILRMDLDFSSTGSVAIVGTIGTAAGGVAPRGMVDLSGSGTASLGSAHIYGNINGACVVTVSSENGGKLLGQTPGNTTEFGYRIILAGRSYDLSRGSAQLMQNGYTGEAGAFVPVQIAYSGLDGRPAPGIVDNYTDSIMFSLAAN
jgi:hypothetical protein